MTAAALKRTMDGMRPHADGPWKPHQIARLERALRFAEQHVGRRTSLRELARVAAIAPHHFLRLFARYTGETVQGHLRRTRLERAGFELFTSDASVTTIGRQCGYGSPAAFARAFARHFGVPPKRFRSVWSAPGYLVSIAPDLRREFEKLPVALVDEPDQRVKFIRRRGPLMTAAPAGLAAVQRLLAATARSREAPIFARTPDFPPVTSPDQLRSDTAFSHGCTYGGSDELAEQTIPGGRFAVFHLDAGPEAKEAIVQLWNYAYLVWAPSERMRIRSFGAYEVYRRRLGHAFRTEVHVPVQPRDQSET